MWMWSVVEYPLLNPACSRGWVSSSVFSSLFVSTFVGSSVCILEVFRMSSLEDYHHLSVLYAVCSRLFDKHLVYSLSSVFEMVSSTDFNVSMFIWHFCCPTLRIIIIVILLK